MKLEEILKKSEEYKKIVSDLEERAEFTYMVWWVRPSLILHCL